MEYWRVLAKVLIYRKLTQNFYLEQVKEAKLYKNSKANAEGADSWVKNIDRWLLVKYFIEPVMLVLKYNYSD